MRQKVVMVRDPLQGSVGVDQAERLVRFVVTDIRFNKVAVWQGLSGFLQHRRGVIHTGYLR